MTLVPAATSHCPAALSGGREAAEAAGRRLAAELSGAPSGVPSSAAGEVGAANGQIEAMARAAIPRLREMGVVAEIVRARRDCLVVRSVAADPLALDDACALVGGWLAALPGVACGLDGTVAESTCATRGHRMCMHTLMWREPALYDADADASASRPGAPSASFPDAPSAPGPGAPSASFASPTPSFLLSSSGSLPTGAPPSSRGLSPAGSGLPGPLPDAASPLPIPAASGTAPAVHPPLAPVPPPPPLGWRAAPARSPRALREISRGPLGSRTAAFGRAPWIRRRAWLLVLGLLAGALGGFVAAGHGGSSYAATAVLEVQSSSTTSAVSSANGAEELAVTYAALIPTDGALLARVGHVVGTGASSVGHSLGVEAVSGTALIDVRFSADTPAEAKTGANEVAAALTAAVPPGRAITPGSVSLVSTATTGVKQGSLHKYGLPIGILLGLLVGAGAALVAERTDRRVDDVDGLSAAAGCSATADPGGISPAELAAALRATGEEPVVFVPLGVDEEHASSALGMRVARQPADAGDALQVIVGAPFSRSAPTSRSGGGTSVLVVAAGQRASIVQEAAERLRLLCQGPAWAVLVPRPRAPRAGPDDHGA